MCNLPQLLTKNKTKNADPAPWLVLLLYSNKHLE